MHVILKKNSDHAVFLPRVGDFGGPALGGGLTFLFRTFSKPLLGDGLSFSFKLVANLVLGGGVLLVRADRAEPDF